MELIRFFVKNDRDIFEFNKTDVLENFPENVLFSLWIFKVFYYVHTGLDIFNFDLL